MLRELIMQKKKEVYHGRSKWKAVVCILLRETGMIYYIVPMYVLSLSNNKDMPIEIVYVAD